jgi:hypothetical protein
VLSPARDKCRGRYIQDTPSRRIVAATTNHKELTTMAVKKISPKSPIAKASTAKGEKKADERKTAHTRIASSKKMMHKR